MRSFEWLWLVSEPKRDRGLCRECSTLFLQRFYEEETNQIQRIRAVGRIEVPAGLPKSEVIGFASASLFFKTFQIHRAVDPEKNVLVYTVVSTKLINGSPFNSISVVPVGVP